MSRNGILKSWLGICRSPARLSKDLRRIKIISSPLNQSSLLLIRQSETPNLGIFESQRLWIVFCVLDSFDVALRTRSLKKLLFLQPHPLQLLLILSSLVVQYLEIHIQLGAKLTRKHD